MSQGCSTVSGMNGADGGERTIADNRVTAWTGFGAVVVSQR